MEQNQKHGPTPKNEGNYLGSHVYKSQNEGWGTRCLPHGLRKRQKQIAWRPIATAFENPALRPGSRLHYLAATRAVAIELLDGESLSWAHEFFRLAFGFFLCGERFPIELRARPADVKVLHGSLLHVLQRDLRKSA